MSRLGILIIPAALLGIIAFNTVTFQVGQWQQAIVLQFGKPVSTTAEAGLHFKLPFVQNVVLLDRRLLEYDAAPKELITLDKQQLVVDNFSRWRIVDPLKFFQTVTGEPAAQSRLDDIIYSTLREAVGRVSLREVVSGDRDTLLNDILVKTNEKASAYGVTVVDIRLKRTELPEKNEANVFSRMRTERERQAKKFRAEGDEEARKIRSAAEKQRRVILAEATRESEITRGRGDAEAAEIYAKAFNQDPEFYRFVRTLEAYDTALAEGTTLVLSPDAEFLRLLGSANTKR